MATLRDFLAQRKAEIDALIAPLLEEREDIIRAEQALGMSERFSIGRPVRHPSPRKHSLKRMALEVLEHAPDGLEANAIRKAIEGMFGVSVSRESLSPQLSRLGQQGVLQRDGYRWKYAPTPEQAFGGPPPPMPPSAQSLPFQEDDVDDTFAC